MEMEMPSLATRNNDAAIGGRRTAAPCSFVHTKASPDDFISITDIRRDGKSLDLTSSIRSQLHARDNERFRALPDLLLWNERGLQYFEDVMNTSEYYLTAVEISLLERHSKQIAEEHFENDTLLLELGSGSLRKTGILLRALEAAGKPIDYYALDLDKNELKRTLHQLKPSGFRHVRCHGLLGTYDDGREWIRKAEHEQRPKCVLSLGSTMGNGTRQEASEFWTGWRDALQCEFQYAPVAKEARFVIGLDGCKDATMVSEAYNDPDGANRRFILNALDHANQHLRYRAFNGRDWMVQGEWDAHEGRHSQYLVPIRDVGFEDAIIAKGERVQVVHSYKYDDAEKIDLWDASRLNEVDRYLSTDRNYGLHILRAPVARVD